MKGEFVKNIGIDIVENVRFKDMITDEKKISRILSQKEVKVFSDFTAESRKVEYLASRFAAKEAVIKAISKTETHYGYRDISILNDAEGAPYVEFNNNPGFYVQVSLSHSDNNSIAIAVLI
jgi:holo-[acyl-carrier protein] synthase